ncbi:MAG: chromosomal replication initiator protein DnaA [Parcubacteria group bacterium LiPW_41]|nr:MAG: chromosomal replication initiator protein DnaA [Parcubacteria group bacterium LiPW_41]
MNHNELWKTVLGEIEVQISRPNFLTWLKNSELIQKDEKEGIALVALPNNFAKEWVKNRYHKIILGSLRNVDSSIKQVNYTVVSHTTPQPTIKKKEVVRGLELVDEKANPISELSINQKTNLNPKYSFDTYIVGSSNELAFAAIQAIINDVGKKYNPLFIYGGVGLGKTHLLQAAGNEVTKKYDGKVRVLYTTSEKFINDVVWSVRNKRMDDMKKKYRDIDMLIVDDIQFIGGKPATELEFFYTFNALYENNKQIIISSDRSPAAIPTLEERLRSRFEGGMIADISYPDYEMRLAILKTKAQNQNKIIDDWVLEYIASKVQRNIREVEGVLNKVIFYEDYKKQKVDQRKLEEIINETIQISPKNISAQDIIKTVAEFYEISQADLTNRGRKQEVVEPRQIAMFLLRDILKLSYPHIGEKLGKRDHTTVIHACEKITKELTQNPNLNQKIMLIKEKMFKTC